MNKYILLLTDYKGFFGSKQYSHYYRGGLDLNKVSLHFLAKEVKVKIMSFSELSFKKNEVVKEKPYILYQSSEDKNGIYKSYIEDVVFDLEQMGLTVIPKYSYLKAHNNKVAMELLRMRSKLESIKTIRSIVFGSYEEIKPFCDKFDFPVVIKTSSGAMSRGVEMADNTKSLLSFAKKISKSPSYLHDIKEKLRVIKYNRKYLKESFNRNKFIVQNLIKELNNDFKVLVYGDVAFALYRGVKKNDFRASGSGDFAFKKELPEGMLEFAWNIQEEFNAPNISLDIAYDADGFHLIEFQFINFGTTTIEKSPFYFERQGSNWIRFDEKLELEETYVKSVIRYLDKFK